MSASELQRAATYFRSMAKATAKTVQMARQDLVDARAAVREGDTSYPLTPEEALAIKCGLEREERLWTQLADEIDGYLTAEESGGGSHVTSNKPPEALVDLFTNSEDHR